MAEWHRIMQLNCLGEFIERLLMTDVEIDCETALKMLACSLQAEGASRPSASSDLLQRSYPSESEAARYLQDARAALCVVG